MTRRFSLTSVVATVALLLACAPLAVVYKGLFEWFVPVTLTVVMVVGAGMGTRAVRANAVLQVLAMIGALLLACTWLFHSGGELLGVIPGPATFGHFAQLVSSAGEDIRQLTLPVDDTDGLVFVVVLGVGTLAVLVELFTGVLATPALVGLPLLTLYLVPVTLLPDSVPWLLFLPGSAGYLWLLLTDNIDRVRRYGRRFAGDGRGIDSWEPSPLATTGRWLTVLALPVAVVLPMLLPGATTGVIDSWYNGGGGTGNGSGAGNSAAVNPIAELEGALTTTQTTELGYVTTDDTSPGYMRMWTASSLTAKGFEADLRLSNRSVAASLMEAPQPRFDVRRTYHQATFTATNLNSAALPLFGTATQVRVGDEWQYDPLAGTVTSESATTKGLEFSYDFTDFEYTPDQLRSSEEVTQTSVAYQGNIAHPTSAVVSDLVDELTMETGTQYDAVLAIHRFFSRANGFRYELSTSDSSGDTASAIENFLVRGRAGYCQQYAAAMAWMVRDAGYPARVAIGLTRGTATGDRFRLTNFNFHAWVEVYFEDFGWVPFDPTPSGGVRNSQSEEWAPDPNSTDDDTDDSADTGSGTDVDNGRPGGDGDVDDNQPRPGEEAGTVVLSAAAPTTVWPYWLVTTVLIALILLSPAVRRNLLRRRRLRSPGGSDPSATALAAWQDLTDSLTDLGIAVSPASTHRTAADRLIASQGLTGSAAAGLRHLAAACEQARYAPWPPRGVDAARALRAALVGLADSRSAWDRVRADLLPASVLHSWRSKVTQITRRISDRGYRIRLGVNRLLRRPSRHHTESR